MIEAYRHNQKWRMRIVNETLEFKNYKEFMEAFVKIVKLKEDKEPYKGGKP